MKWGTPMFDRSFNSIEAQFTQDVIGYKNVEYLIFQFPKVQFMPENNFVRCHCGSLSIPRRLNVYYDKGPEQGIEVNLSIPLGSIHIAYEKSTGPEVIGFQFCEVQFTLIFIYGCRLRICTFNSNQVQFTLRLFIRISRQQLHQFIFRQFQRIGLFPLS